MLLNLTLLSPNVYDLTVFVIYIEVFKKRLIYKNYLDVR